MTPAETIRTRRLAAGLTQAALAAKLSLPYQRVQEWERGTYRPNNPHAVALWKALGGRLVDYLGT